MIYNPEYKNDFIVQIGHVISIEDNEDGGRIKARIHSDNDKSYVDDGLYCFPLLPKVFQSYPKEGEAVLIITSRASDKNSNRWYIGPIISQPQFFYKDNYANESGIPNTGTATSMLRIGGSHVPRKDGLSTKHLELTNGSFPGKDAQAIIGRKGEDVFVRDDEVMMRCGIRIKDQNGQIEGNIALNRGTSAVNFLKYAPEGLVVSLKKPLGDEDDSGYSTVSINSLAGTRAEKIALFSNKTANIYTNNSTKNFPDFMSRDEVNDLFKSLHQLPYGDKLVKFLDKFRTAYLHHEHAWAQEPVTIDAEQSELMSFDLNSIVTNDIWIS